jgi:hypothetical protein
MRETKMFKCKLTNSQINFYINCEKKNAYIDFIYIDFKNIKPFFMLLRLSIDTIKESGIILIKQKITYNDWESIFFESNTSWKILKDDTHNKIYTIECSIDNALENIGIGFGIKSVLKF